MVGDADAFKWQNTRVELLDDGVCLARRCEVNDIAEPLVGDGNDCGID